MSNYYITVSKGLLEPKHREKMQVNQKTSAVWVYLWFLDKITRIEGGLGQVLGGKPIKLTEIDLGYDIKTIRKMVHQLEQEGYIKTKRTPYGRIISVTKAKKVFGQKVAQTELDRTTAPREVSSEKGENAVGLSAQNDKNAVGLIKTIQNTDNNTPAPSADGGLVNQVIATFKEINPAYHLAFKRPPQRAAAKRLLDLHGLERLKTVIGFIAQARGQPYFPTIATPCQLEEKWTTLEDWSKRRKNELKSKSNIAFL